MDGWTDDRGVYWRAAGDDFPNYFPYLINQRDNSIFVADRWQVHTPGIQESSAFINRYVVKWGAWFHPWQPVVIVSLTGHYTVYTPAALLILSVVLPLATQLLQSVFLCSRGCNRTEASQMVKLKTLRTMTVTLWCKRPRRIWTTDMKSDLLRSDPMESNEIGYYLHRARKL